MYCNNSIFTPVVTMPELIEEINGAHECEIDSESTVLGTTYTVGHEGDARIKVYDYTVQADVLAYDFQVSAWQGWVTVGSMACKVSDPNFNEFKLRVQAMVRHLAGTL